MEELPALSFPFPAEQLPEGGLFRGLVLGQGGTSVLDAHQPGFAKNVGAGVRVQPGRAPAVLAQRQRPAIGLEGHQVGHVVEHVVARDDVCLLAPDLRGRGRSAKLPGPYGIAAHIDDLIKVLDHVVLVG